MKNISCAEFSDNVYGELLEFYILALQKVIISKLHVNMRITSTIQLGGGGGGVHRLSVVRGGSTSHSLLDDSPSRLVEILQKNFRIREKFAIYTFLI